MSQNQTTFIEGYLRRMRAGDAGARGDLVNFTQDRFRRLTSKMLRQFPRAEQAIESDDVFQEAMLRLWKALEAVTPDSPRHFFNLAALNIRRVLLDLTRKLLSPHSPEQNEQSLPGGQGTATPFELAQSTFAPDKLAIWTEFHRWAETLEAEEREVLDLVYYDGLSKTEAAELLGITERTVYRRWNGLCEKIMAKFPGLVG